MFLFLAHSGLLGVVAGVVAGVVQFVYWIFVQNKNQWAMGRH